MRISKTTSYKCELCKDYKEKKDMFYIEELGSFDSYNVFVCKRCLELRSKEIIEKLFQDRGEI
jgi:hypothetical protein